MSVIQLYIRKAHWSLPEESIRSLQHEKSKFRACVPDPKHCSLLLRKLPCHKSGFREKGKRWPSPKTLK
jgi:hypothetical protein